MKTFSIALILAIVLLATCSVEAVEAHESPAEAFQNAIQAYEPPVHIVTKDGGGLLNERAFEIARFGYLDIKVIIRGKCFSACTMYLGLELTCVEPGALLGFHAPTFQGTKATAEQTAAAIKSMSNYYPEPIKTWFIDVGGKSKEMLYFTGEQMIRMGIPAC